MKYYNLHSWKVNREEAIRIQYTLRKKLSLRKKLGSIDIIAGADVAYRKGKAIAGVVVLEFPGLKLIEKQYTISPVTFPYIPGLLSFREGPALLRAFQKIRIEPDVILFDGQGIAHPRRMGIATHLGLFLDRPTIGCAKSILVGDYTIPDDCKGKYCLLKENGEVIGAALRTKEGVKPVFVSPGNMIDLLSAIRIVLECAGQYRMPEPIRQTHAFVTKISKEV